MTDIVDDVLDNGLHLGIGSLHPLGHALLF